MKEQEKVELAVSLVFGIPETAIDGYCRKSHLVEGRHMTWHALHSISGLTISEIARRYAKDYNSIKHGVTSIKERRQTDFEFDGKCRRVEVILSEDKHQ